MKLTKHQQRLIKHIKATGQKIQTTVDGRFFLPDGTSVGSRTVSSLCQKECLRPTGSDLLGNISAYELRGGYESH
ncbi:hypothetical protein [Halomonas sp. MS1]|nr:hypothetical protein [Halomonas sp. MS1]UTD55930.1 hypothetical protein NF683_01545 [Halomonas sp. MS1]